MERRDRKAQILNILAKNVRRIVERDVPDVSGLQEIRLRTGQPLRVLRGNRETVLPEEGQPHIVTKEEMRETMEYISHYSLYAYENELRQGFLTVEGGHRVGVAGKVIMEKDKIKNKMDMNFFQTCAYNEKKKKKGGELPQLIKYLKNF